MCLLLFFSACHPRSHLIEPHISYVPTKKQFHTLTSDFKTLTSEETKEEWSKEMQIGILFARDLDLFRAITSFKRALFLLPPDQKVRRMQIEFFITQCYFLGSKYQDAIETFEFGEIRYATAGTFPAFRDLLIILYDCYRETGQSNKSQVVLLLLEKGDPESSLDLKLFSAIDEGNLHLAASLAHNHPAETDVSEFIMEYSHRSKSVTKAQWLNAIAPGAGYLYVGQKKTALTSLVLNTSFIAATYYFFHSGNWGAGLFTTSLELGWYLGGINGAGLAAKEYNEALYNDLGKNVMLKNNIFPVLLLQVGF